MHHRIVYREIVLHKHLSYTNYVTLILAFNRDKIDKAYGLQVGMLVQPDLCEWGWNWKFQIRQNSSLINPQFK